MRRHRRTAAELAAEEHLIARAAAIMRRLIIEGQAMGVDIYVDPCLDALRVQIAAPDEFKLLRWGTSEIPEDDREAARRIISQKRGGVEPWMPGAKAAP